MNFKGFAIATTALALTVAASPAMAGQATSRNTTRSGVESNWSGGKTRTTVDTQVIRNGSYSGQDASRSIKLDVIAPQSGDFKFSVGNSNGAAWSHKGNSAFLYSESSASNSYNYHERFTQNANSVTNESFNNDYTGYVHEVDAYTSAN